MTSAWAGEGSGTQSRQPTTMEVPPGMSEMLVPLGGQLGMGSTLGYCAGVTLRFVGRVAAVGVGGLFCVVQGLSYRGYVQVDWRKVERDYIKLLDKDQDGQVTAGDLQIIFL